MKNILHYKILFSFSDEVNQLSSKQKDLFYERIKLFLSSFVTKYCSVYEVVMHNNKCTVFVTIASAGVPIQVIENIMEQSDTWYHSLQNAISMESIWNACEYIETVSSNNNWDIKSIVEQLHQEDEQNECGRL